jgi:hypothetical protein
MTMLDRLITILALSGTALAGALGGSPWAILAGAVMIASRRSDMHFAFADRHSASLGWAGAWCLFVVASAAGGRLVVCRRLRHRSPAPQVK